MHMQLHTGQFHYFCQKCRKGYNSGHVYQVHMDKHQGIKYQCEFCEKSFAKQQSRDYHLSLHTGQYRFKREVCGKGFNVKMKYDEHMGSHM